MKPSLLALFVIAAACRPAPKLGASRDVDAATPASACANLSALGCSIGNDTHCATAIANVIDAGLDLVDLDCLTRATTKASARACAGQLTCSDVD